MVNLTTHSYYHIYNRGINSNPIFWSDENYKRFIDRSFYYLYPCAEVYSYCLLQNHFHLLLKVRSESEQENLYRSIRNKNLKNSFHGLRYKAFKSYQVSTQIGHLLNSHTKYINVSQDRTGDLFEGRFKRKEIDDEHYLAQIICYIHRNPIHHRISKEYNLYPYSSYNELISEKSTLLNQSSVFKIFGTKENYIAAHEEFKRLLGDDFWLEK